MANETYKMFEPCKAGECENCVAELPNIADGKTVDGVIACACDCHAEGK